MATKPKAKEEKPEPEVVVVGEDGTAIIDPLELSDGISGATDDELTLLLNTLQQASYPEWNAKLTAGSLQRRVVVTLQHRAGAVE